MNERLNIIVVGTSYPYRGGLAAFNERLALQLVEDGHNVEIETFTLQYPSLLFPGKSQYSSSPAPQRLKIGRSINSVNPFNWIKVGRDICRRQPDVVIFAYWSSFIAPCMGTIARICRKRSSIKRIALVHNMLPHEPSLLDRLLPNYFVKHIDGFLTLSKAVVVDINRFDKRNVSKIAIPHPIYDNYGTVVDYNEALQHLQLPPNARYILFFGFVRQYKGLDLLIEAFADSRLRGKNLKLIVAGEFYDNRNRYLQQIEDLGLNEEIILHSEYIESSLIAHYFSVAEIVVQPYRSATQSGVTQIAYHFDKPMLVTNVGGLSEIVPNGRCGYVVDAAPKEIANALFDFFENNRYNEMSGYVAKEKRRFAWSSFSKGLSMFIDTI